MNEALFSLFWYFVIGLSMVLYVVLDGFDLGVGILHLFTKKDEERRILLNAIGPVWDGNEVWLVIVGGALFAGFPAVYATLFSGFYDLCMILLAGLMFRAVAIEFRSKRESPKWRKGWDRVFCAASIVITFGLGLTFGNIMEGLPLDANREFVGNFALFFRPYPVLVGLFLISLLAMHGAIYLAMKTEGELHAKLRVWAKRSIWIFIGTFCVITFATWMTMPTMTRHYVEQPWHLLIPLVSLLAILNVPREFTHNNDGRAFLSSAACIMLLFVVFGVATFPNLVHSLVDPANNSMTLYNSAASFLTLKVLLIIVAIGIPLVFAYSAMVYRIFRGKVKIDKMSY